MHNNWSNKPLQNRNPKRTLQTTVLKENCTTRVYRFPGLSSTCIDFPGLSSPGECQNKIPGLSGISRTRTNPAKIHLPDWASILLLLLLFCFFSYEKANSWEASRDNKHQALHVIILVPEIVLSNIYFIWINMNNIHSVAQYWSTYLTRKHRFKLSFRENWLAACREKTSFPNQRMIFSNCSSWGRTWKDWGVNQM